MSVYFQESRLTGSLTAELDNTRLRVERRKPFRKPVTFTVDVACLAPALAIAAPEGLLGLGLAAVFALALAGIAIYGMAMNELLSTMTWGGVAALTLCLAVILAVLFRLRLLKRLVVQTRCAGLPLLVTPVLPHKRSEMEAFLALVRVRIGEAETKRGFTAEHLRSGELKTLRRLASEKVIPDKRYEDAKLVILAR